jgi:hypothetical protein
MRGKRTKQLRKFTNFIQKWAPGRSEITYRAMKRAYMSGHKQTILRDLKSWKNGLKGQR